jgi:hypothetical protein
MRIAGSPGSEDRNKFIAVCCFAVLAVLVLYFELRDPTPAAPPAPPVITTSPAQASISPTTSSAASPTRTARKIGTTDAALDPTLHTEPMRRTESVAYEGIGRNIFSAAPVEVSIPRPIQSARPKPVVAQGPPPPPPGPPPPPPIDLRFSGYFLSPATGERQAVLIHGDDVVLAHQGDVVLRRYKILSISANSIQVEDMPNNNRQVLPLVSN